MVLVLVSHRDSQGQALGQDLPRRKLSSASVSVSAEEAMNLGRQVSCWMERELVLTYGLNFGYIYLDSKM